MVRGPKYITDFGQHPSKVNPMVVHDSSGFSLAEVAGSGDRPFRYPHPFNIPDLEPMMGPPQGHVEDAKTLAELRMMALSWAIRSKKDWQSKLRRPEVLNRWKEEAASQQEHLSKEEKLSPNMLNYIFTELEAYAKLSDATTGIQHACNDATFSSHNLIPNEVACELRSGVARLEDIPDYVKDWHPGSDNQVLDLVHPSLYCLVYNRTFVRGSLSETPKPLAQDTDPFLSKQFAWIPSDFHVGKDGEVCLVSPYINNLHKRNEGLYSVISKTLGYFVPMFERVLGAIDRTDRPRARGSFLGHGIYPGHPLANEKLVGEYFPLPGRIQYGGKGDVPCLWTHKDHSYSSMPYDRKVSEHGYAEYPGDTLDDRYMAWMRTQPMTLLEAHAEYQGALESAFRKADLRGRTLQCIVKLANIHLTPENPNYPGGNWHVEGMFNQGIVSTGIYYYDSENISESQLAFRTSVGEPPYHEQNDSLCMQILYGIDRDDPLVQERGSIATSAGLALAFPNIYQHRVSSFHLADPNKPGHRMILAFFLVDPNHKVPSATDVAPQQEEWMQDFMEDFGPDGIQGTHLEKLPTELKRMIVERTEGLMNKQEANSIREELMKERSHFVKVYDEGVMQVGFNMCEH